MKGEGHKMDERGNQGMKSGESKSEAVGGLKMTKKMWE